MSLLWKTPRIEKEWYELPLHNPKLPRLIKSLVDFVDMELGKDVVLTEIYRSPAEYAALYAQNPAAIPKNPPHTNWQAADLRSSIYSPAEINRMLTYLNGYRFFKGSRPVAIYHQIAGNVMHFHVQYGNDA